MRFGAARFWAVGTALLAFCLLGRLEAAELPKGVKALNTPGVHNMFQVATNLFSGSAPEGEDGFAALAKVGIKTIVTVDGAKPDVALAHKYGMRYVHLPHGYDGIGTNTQVLLVKAVNGAEGSVFIHCHHGKHRGPAAAAVVCLANDYWTKAQAEAWLLTAGTATKYVGLYEVARNFKKPTREQMEAAPAEFPEVAQVSGLIEAMVAVDNHWDNLKAVRAAGYRTPKNNPDLKPANEAVILWEHFREAQRLGDSIRRGTNFLGRLTEAEGEAKEAEELLKKFSATPSGDLRGQLDRSFEGMGKSCVACHTVFRDAAGIKAAK